MIVVRKEEVIIIIERERAENSYSARSEDTDRNWGIIIINNS